MAEDEVDPAAAPPGSSGGGFLWGLTPSGSAPEAPQAEPAVPALPPAALDWDTPTVASPITTAPTAGAWDTPTVATPLQQAPPAPVAFTGGEVARQEFPGFGTPVDSALEGVTEAFDAQPVGIGIPDDEGLEVSALDSLFGENSFVEYQDALIPVLPPRASGGGELVLVNRSRPIEGRAPVARLQKILMGVAGALVAALLLVVLFLAGNRIAASAPAPAVAAPSPSASAVMPAVGPAPPGEYYWDALLGGECLSPFLSPWEDKFTVVDCSQSHPAQLLLKGTLPATEDPAYPGGDALQKLAATLCSIPTVIDYPATAGANDIQIVSSFAADETDWNDGNRTFYCFASRTGATEFTTSIAQPQVLPTETPTP